MPSHKIAVYYAWSRPGETGAPLGVIENRFPAVFELRRMLYPDLQELADPRVVDQGVRGFLDHVMKKNFASFVEQANEQTGQPTLELERLDDNRRKFSLDDSWLKDVDTLIVISFDSMRTAQMVDDAELDAVRSFLSKPGNLLFVSLHHDVGDVEHAADDERRRLQEMEFLHHGDKTLPSQQRFGGFGRSLLAGLGVPVENRFGLRPAAEADGTPSPIEIERQLDRSLLLEGVTTFNLHPHLPHLERLGEAVRNLDVLARQPIDLAAPPHPFTQSGRHTFDALLQSRAGIFAGDLLVCDATLWSSNAGGLGSLHRFWTNVIQRELQS